MAIHIVPLEPASVYPVLQKGSVIHEVPMAGTDRDGWSALRRQIGVTSVFSAHKKSDAALKVVQTTHQALEIGGDPNVSDADPADASNPIGQMRIAANARNLPARHIGMDRIWMP